MTPRRRSLTTIIASVALAGGTFCFGQAQPGAAGGAGAGGAPAAEHRAAPGGHDANAGKQVDQQINQQLQKIQQQKDNLVGDRLFVLNTAIANQFEMSLAHLAQQKAQDPSVKQLAQRIMQDHQQAAQQLQQVAQKLQVEVPQGLPSIKQQELQIIGGMESKMFDQKFVACMDELHAKDVSSFRNAAQMAQSPDVKQFASQTLPKLREHWQLTKRTANSVGLSTDEAQPAGGRIRGTPGTDTPGGATPGGDNKNRPGGASTPGGTGTGSGGTGTGGTGGGTTGGGTSGGGATPGSNR